MSSGATNGGAMQQLLGRGALDYFLTGNATSTLWRFNNTAHTNFATEPIQQPFDNTPSWNGSTANCTISRTGDLLHRQYVVVDLPPILAAAGADGSTTGYAYTGSATTAGDADAAHDDQAYRYYTPYDELFAGLANATEGFWCCWVNAVGFAMLREVQLSIGQHIVDKFGAEYLFCWEELTGKSGKRCWDMIGRFETLEQQIVFARNGGRLHIPLPWWFTQITGNALSLITLSFNAVKVHITFELLSKLVIVSNRNILVYVGNSTTLAITSTLLAASHLTAYIQSEMVYLDVSERTSFLNGEFDTLMCGVQTATQTISSGSTSELTLPFNFPVQELIVCARMRGNYEGSRLFEFGRGIPTSVGQSGGTYGPAALSKPMFPIQTEGSFQYQGRDLARIGYLYREAAHKNTMNDSTGQWNLANRVIYNADPFVDMTLNINHNPRMATQPMSFFRQVQPQQHHTRIPSQYIYVMSFAMFPEDPNSSGALNFSRVDNAKLRLTVHPDCVGYEMTLFVFARYWNLFSYTQGVGGAKYAS